MIGLLGTNPESWRLQRLSSSLDRLGIPHKALFPWLFSLALKGGKVLLSYDSRPLSDSGAFDVVYVISLGFEDLQETLYKLRLLEELEGTGARLVNSIGTIRTCRNKASMTLKLVSEGIRMPDTMITESVHLAVEYIEERRPCVLKPITGLQGRGLTLIPASMGHGDILDYVSWFQARYGKDVIYVQEFIDHPGYDIRVLVAGGRVVSKMRRFNPEGWRTNIHAGALPMVSEDPVEEMALEAANAVGGDVVGVDILPSKGGEHYVLEVNSFPGWKGLQEVTEGEISDTVARYLSSLI
jgi:RimK family alpha-L-glutamate ligase